MVAPRYWENLSRMAPGANSMLRSRRKDKDVRPNRLLDRTASRGMLYENEELRLRTININADLEKGQQYIKKLRRENSQLRRDIWNLRDQYDKLENMIRSQEHEQLTEDPFRYDQEIRDDTDQLETLSIVVEESENEDCKSIEQTLENTTTNNVFDDMNTISVNDGLKISDENESSSNVESNTMASLKTCEDFVCEYRKNAEEQKTLVFGVDTIENLNVQEVIDSLEQIFSDNCSDVVKGVRLTNRNCFISLKDSEGRKKLLETEIKIRDNPVIPEHLWDHSTILQLSAVPHQIQDERIVATVSRFADVIGCIRRQTYKGLDTGERFLHIKTPELIPSQLLFGSICIPVTIIYPKSERSNIARRKSFRSHININLQTPEKELDKTSPKLTDSDNSQDTSQNSATIKESSFFSKSTGVVLTAADVEPNVFQFPNSVSQIANQSTCQKKITPPGFKDQKSTSGSPSVFRKFTQRSFRKQIEVSQPPSPAVLPITPKFVRRSSVNFRNGPSEGVLRSRGLDGYYDYESPFMRERSTSDVSSGRQSICRRKLSVTGHEEVTKIPWCGCWGIGCC